MKDFFLLFGGGGGVRGLGVQSLYNEWSSKSDD